MCFYVNLRELWPLGSIFSRAYNETEDKARVKRFYACRDENNHHNEYKYNNTSGLTDDSAPKAQSRQQTYGTTEAQLAPHWLTDTSKHNNKTQADLESGEFRQQQQQQQQHQSHKNKHYGNNLLASLDESSKLTGGDSLLGSVTKTRFEADGSKLLGFDSPRSEQLTPASNSVAIMSTGQQQTGPPQPTGDQQQTGNQTTQTTSNPENRPEIQDYQQQLAQNASKLPEPTRQELAEASKFRIRTARRRHLDFDPDYQLDEREAPQRSKWSGPFHFIQAADCQFGMIDSYVHHRTEPGWREEIELCQRLVSLCNRMEPKPLFMVICGDLIDSLPASEIGRRQVVDFKRIFAKLDPEIPLVCVCGNHDVGDEPTSKTINDYRATFGEDYFYFTKNDLLFIVINSQFYQNRVSVQAEASEQDRWLECLLAKCKLFKYSIIFEHIPWFLVEPHEENDYFNIRKEIRLHWLEKFKAAGVTKVMCGHYHRNAGGWFDGMELVVTSAIGAQLGADKSGIRIVRVLDESIEHQYYAMDDVPLKIELGRRK